MSFSDHSSPHKPQPSREQVVKAARAFYNAKTWIERKHIVETRSDLLLSDVADQAFATMLDRYQSNADVVQRMEECRVLLWRCREMGLEAAFAEKMDRAERLEDIPAKARDALGRGGTGPNIPAELDSILHELNRPAQRRDMPRRVALCQQALELVKRSSQAQLWALLQNKLGNSLVQNPRGDQAENLDQAIYHYTLALEVKTRQVSPVDWAATQNNTANAYSVRIRGDRADNLEQAIHRYTLALEVKTRQAFPADWSMIQNNLANAYSERIQGDRADNLEQAIHHYTLALKVRTRQVFPADWAMTQDNLASAYCERIRGERADNLEQAIHHYTLALEVYTRQVFPADWADTQNNLATAYADRIRGERADNLERAIHRYTLALEVRTRQTDPERWAMTQNNLATAYQKRIEDKRAENLERAIHHHTLALEVYTRQAFPSDWADTRDNLASAYSERIRGDRAENLEQAIHHHTLALEVRTRQTNPERWAMTQNNLATAYQKRIRGERAENLEQAIHHYTLALEVRTRQTDPERWAMTQHNLASAYSACIQDERAENLERAIHHCTLALEVYTRQDFPANWAATQYNLASAYRSRIQGEQADNLEQAIHYCTLALEVYTRQAFPSDWAMTQNNLASAYQSRIRGERAENLEQAIHYYTLALEVRKRQAMPDEHRRTQRNLGDLCFKKGRWVEAVTAYQGALAAGELLYEAAATPEARQAELREARGVPTRLAYGLAQEGGSPALQGAVMALERNRARWLSEALTLRGDKPPAVPDEVWGKLKARRETVQGLQGEARLPERTPGKRAFLELSAAFRASQEALSEAVEQVREYDEGFMPDPTFEQIREVATPEWPLAYLAVTSAGALGLVVSVEGKVGLAWSDLTGDELNELLIQEDKERRKGYLPAQFRQASMHMALRELLPTLGKRLVAPLVEKLREMKADGVTLISCGWLGLIPLHAARYQRDGQEVCLLDEFDVAYAPSATVLGAARRALAEREETLPVLAGVGNPLENPRPLKYARPELEEIVGLFPKGATHRVLYEHEATEDRLVEALPGATYVHLSCHGVFNSFEPLNSHLQLANETVFTLREVLAAEYLADARLVVLSACQTAISDFNNLPDEVIGLPAGFFQAGVPGVVGTLWSVNDLSTMLLMVRFYKYHLQGDEKTGEGPMSPVRALRRAQGWLRDVTSEELSELFKEYKETAPDGPERSGMAYELARDEFSKYALEYDRGKRPFARPYYWAGFVFYGV